MKRISGPIRVAPIVFLLVSAVFVITACAASDGESSGSPTVREISQQDLVSNPPEGALILDVRTPGEFGDGHVPSAVNIPHNELAGRLAELESEPDRPIILYCRSGKRAGIAASVLQEAGYTDLHHLTGDMMAWTAEGLPTE